MRSRSYMGWEFEVWKVNRTWFWSVADLRRKSCTIGAAANERDAVCDACTSIDEMIALDHSRPVQQIDAIDLFAMVWKESLTKLGNYLSSMRATTALR